MNLQQKMAALFLFREFGKEIQSVPSVLEAENNIAQTTNKMLDIRASITHEQSSYIV